MPEYQENSFVRSINWFSETLYRLTLHAPHIAAAAQPGQFVMARCSPFGDPLLRRPFSVHRVLEHGEIQLLVRIIGRGTRALSQLHPGDQLSLIGPLGRSFHHKEKTAVCLVGGGIGIAPLLFLAEHLMTQLPKPRDCMVLLGGRTGSEVMPLAKDFRDLGCLVECATDDGSFGHHGMVTALLPSHLASAGQVFTCGPHAMMAAVAAQCRKVEVPCTVSLEAHMACGLGACLGCTIHGTAEGRYLHVCKDGPVMPAAEVLWTK